MYYIQYALEVYTPREEENGPTSCQRAGLSKPCHLFIHHHHHHHQILSACPHTVMQCTSPRPHTCGVSTS